MQQRSETALGLRPRAPFVRAALEGLGWRRGRVPVLMYHRVHPDPHVLSVSPESFEAQVRFLKEYAHPVTLSEVVDARRRGLGLPPRSVALTFDDGYQDNYVHAYPILRRYEVPATFFVTTGMVQARRHFWWDRVQQGMKPSDAVARAWPAIAPALAGRDRASQIGIVTETLKQVPTHAARDLIDAICHPLVPTDDVTMTWDQIRLMAADGMEIGSHTVTHPILSMQAPEEAAWEVRQSKLTLERELGLPIRHFAYPNGRSCDFSRDVIAHLEDAGYQSACSTMEGVVTRRSEMYALERVGIYHDPSLPRFIRALLRACVKQTPVSSLT